MRQAHTDVGLIRDEAGTILGLSLGFDYCAEHEGGIGPLKALLGVGAAAEHGVNARLVTKTPEDLAGLFYAADFPKGTKTMPPETRLVISPSLRWTDNPEGRGNKTPHLFPQVSPDPKWLPKLAAAWDDRGFSVRAFGEEERQTLRDILLALSDGDLALGLGRALPFGNSPISLVIASRLSADQRATILAADLAARRLQEAAEATGIVERLKKAGRGYYALKPDWVSRFTSLVGREGNPADQTRHKVIFFLNPMDQRNFNYGWFTVEELDAWIEGRGPVLKEKASA